MSNATPGQVAYEAYCAAMDATLLWPSDRWHRLAQITQAAWEAAAQAVLTQAGLLVLDLDPNVQKERRDA